MHWTLTMRISNFSHSLALARRYLKKEVIVVFDRPMGSKHPRYGFVYEVNYGYVPGTRAPDNEELDVYYLGANGPLSSATGKCIALIHRLDDDDDKLIVIPTTHADLSDAEIAKAIHFQEQWFDYEIVRK